MVSPSVPSRRTGIPGKKQLGPPHQSNSNGPVILTSFFQGPPPALAMAVLQHPEALLALEPKSELDPGLVSKVWKAADAEISGHHPVRNPSMLALFRGGLLYALDALDPAHTIFQDDSSPYGSNWHGMMHRREGDFSNACYWFSRAGTLPVASQIRDLLRSIPLDLEWSPEAFTRRCEKMARSRPDMPLETLQVIQKTEFFVLMRHCWNAAVAEGRTS